MGKTAEQKSIYSAFFAEFKPDLSEEQIDTLKDNLDSKDLKAVTIKDQQKIIFATIDAVVVILNIFGVVALTAASFGIINTLFMAVQERTKEIGLMKAVGMSKGKIFALFSIEATLLGLFGSLLGVGAASILGRIANNIATEGFLKDFEGLTLLSFRWQSITVIVLIITFIAFLAGTLPARKASKLDPIEALRYE
jgi:putative ABC transport system permease protein